MWMWSTGINRNIVECKDKFGVIPQGCTLSINRNIVECKVLVLVSVSLLSACINRNIVECKVILSFPASNTVCAY